MNIEEYLASKTSEELAVMQAQGDLNLLRQQRDTLLAATDWWVLSDRSPTQAQLHYRQALRDITQHYVSPLGVIWPEKPVSADEQVQQ